MGKVCGYRTGGEVEAVCGHNFVGKKGIFGDVVGTVYMTWDIDERVEKRDEK